MPLVYACICPHEPPPEGVRTIAALAHVVEELSALEVETMLVVSSRGPAQRQAMGVLTASHVDEIETDRELAVRVLQEATRADVRTVELRRWEGPLPYPLPAIATRVLALTTCWLDPRAHFELGRAVGKALTQHERRIALVCSVELSHALTAGAPGYDPAGRVFDQHYRRAIDAWDVRWLVGLERGFRQHAAEDAVPQTAVLMGALGAYRIQPRVLSYEAPGGTGCLVAAIDVLGPRKKERAETKSSAPASADEP